MFFSPTCSSSPLRRSMNVCECVRVSSLAPCSNNRLLLMSYRCHGDPTDVVARAAARRRRSFLLTDLFFLSHTIFPFSLHFSPHIGVVSCLHGGSSSCYSRYRRQSQAEEEGGDQTFVETDDKLALWRAGCLFINKFLASASSFRVAKILYCM